MYKKYYELITTIITVIYHY